MRNEIPENAPDPILREFHNKIGHRKHMARLGTTTLLLAGLGLVYVSWEAPSEQQERPASERQAFVEVSVRKFDLSGTKTRRSATPAPVGRAAVGQTGRGPRARAAPEYAMNAGLLELLKGSEIGESSVFGPGGLGTGVNHAMGGLRGPEMGDAGGAGALGPRLRFGQPSEGLGSLGTLGAALVSPPTEPEPDSTGTGWVRTEAVAQSTFAVDVDTASYARVRQSLQYLVRPDPESIRVEEMLNAFRYAYSAPPPDGLPIAIHADGGRPFETRPRRAMLRVGLQAAVPEAMPPLGVVFLIDVSCSMTGEDRLGRAKRGVALAARHLRPEDWVGLVTYANGSAVRLEPTPATEIARIDRAVRKLSSSGGTAMGDGLGLAYRLAETQRAQVGGRARVVVISDGDANIGAQTWSGLLDSIQSHVDAGIGLSTIGVGTGNYRDALMEQLANKGNGNYFYLDSESEMQRVLGDNLFSMLHDVVRDVKVQVEFNPEVVERFRRVGYVNRSLRNEDFEDDTVDAGEVGAGHQVTALYELRLSALDPDPVLATIRIRGENLATGRVEQRELEVRTKAVLPELDEASPDLALAASLTGAAALLSKQRSPWRPRLVSDLAEQARDGSPDREQWLELLELARPWLHPRASSSKHPER